MPFNVKDLASSHFNVVQKIEFGIEEFFLVMSW